MKKIKILISSLLAIAASLSIVIGSSYALLTTTEDTNIAVTSGEAKVSASLNELSLYSPKSIDPSNGSIVDATNIADTSAGTFGNGGTASISEGDLILSNITKGDKATFKINFTNDSNINIKYKVNFADITSYNGSESYKLIDKLVIKANDSTIASDGIVVDWTSVAIEEEISDVTVSVELPAATNDNYQNLSSSLRFSVEAIQGNTYIEIVKKDATVTAPTAKTELVYNGTNLELVNAGITNGGTWQYKLGDGEYSTNVPTATSVGTYTVYYKLVGDANYNDIAEASVQVMIAKTTQTAPNAPETEYEGDFSVELKPVSSGHGTTYYGCSTTNDASTVTNWQTSVIFDDLDDETTYYFFAKYAGNDTYNEAVSQGTEVTTSACFVAGTKISMADGSFKNIEEIVIGDEVVSYDVIKGEFYTTTINKVWASTNTTISTITLTDGTQIQCTPNHPICTIEGFKSVDPDFTGGLNEYPSTKMNVGDLVVTDHGTFAVSSIETNVGESVAVYNLSVVSNSNELNNTFVANGVVVHNKLM